MAETVQWNRVYHFHQDGEFPQLPDSVRSIQLAGKAICLIYTRKKYFAIQDRCPHAGAKFSAGGWCANETIICPLHRQSFNLINGRGSQGDYIPVYPVEIREDGVYVGIPLQKKWWWPF